MGNAGDLAELHVRHRSACFSQVPGQLLVEISHKRSIFCNQRCTTEKFKDSELVREHVRNPQFKLPQHRIQLVHSEMMFAFFNPVQRHVGNTGLFGELGIREISPLFTQEGGQLTVEALSHARSLANKV